MKGLDRLKDLRIKRGPTGKWIIYPTYQDHCGYKHGDIKLIAHLLSKIGEDLDDGTANDVIIKWQ